MYSKKIILRVLFLATFYSYSQEGIPVYSDYLSDNYYLIHPSMAGAANCAKIRLTGRRQWFGQEGAPELQTLSFNGRLTDRVGAGVILFNDKNGFHSQNGVKLTYTYHLLFSRDEVDLNQLSFGISGGLVERLLDETSFLNSGVNDPLVNGTIKSQTYFNFDIGASYNYLDLYFHGTIKNALETRRNINPEFQNDNLRKYLLSAGYVFDGKSRVLFEPSVLLQLEEKTKEASFDINFKTYKKVNFGTLWAGISYRKVLGGAPITNGTTIQKQNLQYITPILGVNYKKFLFAYTYSQISGAVKFDNGAYHQITLGMDLFCRREKYECNCPAIN